MASIERTVYPRFRHNLTVDEIAELFKPIAEEIAFVEQYARRDDQQLSLLLSLKSVQRLGYFPAPDDIPQTIQRFMCDVLKISRSVLPIKLRRPSVRVTGIVRFCDHIST